MEGALPLSYKVQIASWDKRCPRFVESREYPSWLVSQGPLSRDDCSSYSSYACNSFLSAPLNLPTSSTHSWLAGNISITVPLTQQQHEDIVEEEWTRYRTFAGAAKIGEEHISLAFLLDWWKVRVHNCVGGFSKSSDQCRPC